MKASIVIWLLSMSIAFVACQKTKVETTPEKMKKANSGLSRFNSYGAKHWVDAQNECMGGEPDNCTTTNLINFNDNNTQEVLTHFNDIIATQNGIEVQNFFNGQDWHIIFPILAESYMSNELNFIRSGNCVVELVINPSDNTHYYLFKRMENNNVVLDFVIPTQQE